jgi:hypothetical protein
MSACWRSEVMFQKEWLSHVTRQQLVWLKIEIVQNAEALESVVGRSQTSNVAKDGLFRNVSPRGGCATTHPHPHVCGLQLYCMSHCTA